MGGEGMQPIEIKTFATQFVTRTASNFPSFLPLVAARFVEFF
jgi:hypothetical protein